MGTTLHLITLYVKDVRSLLMYSSFLFLCNHVRTIVIFSMFIHNISFIYDEKRKKKINQQQ
jgi:hypothetical protein